MTSPESGSWRVVGAVEGWMVVHPTKPPVGPWNERENAEIARQRMEVIGEMSVEDELRDELRRVRHDLEHVTHERGLAEWERDLLQARIAKVRELAAGSPEHCGCHGEACWPDHRCCIEVKRVDAAAILAVLDGGEEELVEPSLGTLSQEDIDSVYAIVDAPYREGVHIEPADDAYDLPDMSKLAGEVTIEFGTAERRIPHIDLGDDGEREPVLSTQPGPENEEES